MREVSKEGTDLISYYEGRRLKPYKDVAGRWTIGTGHLITAEQATQWAAGITDAQADTLLARDLTLACAAVTQMISVPLTQGEYDALVSFSFNLGASRLRASTLRMRLNRGDKSGAANEFPKWCYAGGVRVKGLLNRRMAERSLFIS